MKKNSNNSNNNPPVLYDFLKIDIADHSKLFKYNPQIDLSIGLDKIQEIIETEIKSKKGTLWGWSGDGGLAAFKANDKSDKVYECACNIREEIKNYCKLKNRKIANDIRIRIALHRGDAIYKRTKGQIHSQAINFVAHLESKFVAEGDICISGSFYIQLSQKYKNNFHKIDIFEEKEIYSEENTCRGFYIIHSDHSKLPARRDSLEKYLFKELRIFSTTADSYFTDSKIFSVLKEKVLDGLSIKVLLLDPDSDYFGDRQFQEKKNHLLKKQEESIRKIDELIATIDKIRKNHDKLDSDKNSKRKNELDSNKIGKIEYRFFSFAPTYQALILDNKKMFISIPILENEGTIEFPCLEITNGHTTEELFSKFTLAFDRAWPVAKRIINKYSYRPIEYHDSWLSIDPIVGCKNECIYCLLRQPGWHNIKPKYELSPKEILDILEKNRYFINNETILSFGNRTDAFLTKENVAYTLELLRELKTRKINNPICIATKSNISDKIIEEIKKINLKKLVFILSYSGLNNSYEVNINHNNVRENFQKLHRANIPILHYWRPLISENMTDYNIKRVLSHVSKYAKASIIIGLKSNPSLKNIYSKEMEISVADKENYGEIIDANELNKLLKYAKSEYPDYPIYRHTSCAVSYILGKGVYS